MQWACSFGLLYRTSAAISYQLPGVASSTACPTLILTTARRQACAHLDGKKCNSCVHQPSTGSTLLSHVAIHPPSPFLESVAVRSLCFSYPRRAQSCSLCTLMTAHHFGRMKNPSPVSPDELESICGSPGGPVHFRPRPPTARMHWCTTGPGVC